MQWAVMGLLAVGAALATAPGEAGPPAQPEFLLDPPTEPWRAARWPVVVALSAQPAEMAADRERLRPLVTARGALLVTTTGGDEVKLHKVLHLVQTQQPVLNDQMVLVGHGELATWCWQELLGHAGMYSGLVAVDATVPLLLLPVPGQQAVTPGKACLLVTLPDRSEGNRRLEQALARWGLTCAYRQVRPDELPLTLGAALTALLPPPPARTQLTDPAIHATFKAPPGWHFERRDAFLAIARPDEGSSDLLVEIVAGRLGRYSFESYVAEVGKGLTDKWIEQQESQRLSAPDAPVLMHYYQAIDRRGNGEQQIAWYLLGVGDRAVSLRAVGPLDQLAPRLPQIRALADGVCLE